MIDETGTLTAPSVGADGSGSSIADTGASPTTVEEQSGAPLAGDEAAQPDAGDQTQTGAEADQQPGEETAEEKGLPKHIKALKATDPQGYKAAKAQFFEHKEYKQTFPTVAEARKAKQAIDLAGGEAGLAEMQADNAEFTTVAKNFVAADPKFAEHLFKEDSIAAAQHVPHMLDELQKHDAPGYNRLIAKQFATEFKAVNLRGTLEAIYGAIKAGKTDDALATLENAAVWHDKIQNIAKQEENPEVKRLREQMRQQNESGEKAKLDEFQKSYRTEGEAHVTGKAKTLVDSFTKGRKLEPDERQILETNVINIANGIMSDGKTFPDFAKQRDILYNRRDKNALVRYVNSVWDQALDISSKRVMRVFGASRSPATASVTDNGKGKPAAAAGARPAAGDQGFVRINERPNGGLIDRNRTTSNMIMNEKRAFLKDGRKVTWAHLN